MEYDLTAFLIICPLVFLSGFVDSVAGGGGLISLPAYFLGGLPVHAAIATNKISAAPGAVVATWRFWKSGHIDVPFMLPSVAAALVGSFLGARLALMIDETVIRLLMFFILPPTAWCVLKRKDLDPGPLDPLPRRKALALTVGISFIIGGYDGFYGPGTGTFLILLYTALARMDLRSAVGGSKMVNLASNVAAVAAFSTGGMIQWRLGLTAAAFCMAGSYFGSGLAIKKGSDIVRPLILAVLALLFIRLALEQA